MIAIVIDIGIESVIVIVIVYGHVPLSFVIALVNVIVGVIVVVSGSVSV